MREGARGHRLTNARVCCRLVKALLWVALLARQSGILVAALSTTLQAHKAGAEWGLVPAHAAAVHKTARLIGPSCAWSAWVDAVAGLTRCSQVRWECTTIWPRPVLCCAVLSCSSILVRDEPVGRPSSTLHCAIRSSPSPPAQRLGRIDAMFVAFGGHSPSRSPSQCDGCSEHDMSSTLAMRALTRPCRHTTSGGTARGCLVEGCTVNQCPGRVAF